MAKEFTQDFQDAFDTYHEGLKNFVHSRIPRKEDVEDLLQEVWYQLDKTLKTQNIRQIKSWIYQVARNKIIDTYRKRPLDWLEDYLWTEDEEGEYFYADFLESSEQPDYDYLREQFWEELYEALDDIPANQREVFLMNEMEGITLREIAEQKGEGLKTIISRKRYAVLHLRERLGAMFEELVEE